MRRRFKISYRLPKDGHRPARSILEAHGPDRFRNPLSMDGLEWRREYWRLILPRIGLTERRRKRLTRHIPHQVRC